MKPRTGNFALIGLILLSCAVANQKPVQASERYDQLVNRGEYSAAANYVIQRYGFAKNLRFGENLAIWDRLPEYIYSMTLPVGLIGIKPVHNLVVISKDSFLYDGKPSEGWLAALLGHELVHRGQPIVVRSTGNINEYWQAVSEFPAWFWMLNNAERLHLTEDQLAEVRAEVRSYRNTLKQHGD